MPNNLKALREAADLTAFEAAVAVGLTRPQTIYEAESGTTTLGAETLRKLAVAYGCDFVEARPARLVARKPNPKVRR